MVLVRVAQTAAQSAENLSRDADAVVAALKQAKIGSFEVVGTEIVGPVVGQQLKTAGHRWRRCSRSPASWPTSRCAFRSASPSARSPRRSTTCSLTLAFLAFFRYDMTLNVIAGLLTITGYSVNDTIVVFDRVRENMRGMRRDNLAHIVNVAVNQTLGRTVITAGTTLLSVVALYLFGGEVLEGFAFTMLVGIISGTYSTVFIAAAIAIMWQGRKPIKGQVAAAPETPEAGPAPCVVGLCSHIVPVSVAAAVAARDLQGLTEFLPVSSSAHLILARAFFGWDVPADFGLAFDVALHIGTLAAILAFFRREIAAMVAALPSVLSPGA